MGCGRIGPGVHQAFETDLARAKLVQNVEQVPILRGGARFDPAQCTTFSGKTSGSSQVTALLRSTQDAHRTGRYEISFRAVLVEPWFAKLVRPVPLTSKASAVLVEPDPERD